MKFLTRRTEPSQYLPDTDKTLFFDKFSTREFDDNFNTNRCWLIRRSDNEGVGHVVRTVVIGVTFDGESYVDKLFNSLAFRINEVVLEEPVYVPADALFSKFSCMLDKLHGWRYGIKTKQDLITYHHYNNTMERSSEKKLQDTTFVLQQVESVF